MRETETCNIGFKNHLCSGCVTEQDMKNKESSELTGEKHFMKGNDKMCCFCLGCWVCEGGWLSVRIPSNLQIWDRSHMANCYRERQVYTQKSWAGLFYPKATSYGGPCHTKCDWQEEVPTCCAQVPYVRNSTARVILKSFSLLCIKIYFFPNVTLRLI